MNALLHPVRVLGFYLLLFWLALGLIVGSLASLPLLLLPRKRRERFVQWCISVFCQQFLWAGTCLGVMRLDLKALDVLNQESRMLLLANHPSMIDVFLILSRVRHVVCLMKSSIRRNLFLGVGAYLAGYVSNRHVDQTLRRAIDSVRDGGLLLTFPEGTRTTRQPVNFIKPGFALIARRAGAPMQTILITTNSPYLGAGWKIWRVPPLPIVYKAVPGQSLRATESYVETARQLQLYFEQTLERSVDPGLQVSP